jgi:hypothetical protein
MSKRINLNKITFDGTNDHIEVPNSNVRFTFSDAASDKPFSITAWVRVNDIASDSGAIITKSDFSKQDENGHGNATEWFLQHAQGSIKFFLYDSPPATSKYLRISTNAAVVQDNVWALVAATYDGSAQISGLSIYKFDGSANDGAPPSTATTDNYTKMTTATEADITIGATQEIDADAVKRNERLFEGALADIVVYDKELTLSEVTEVYNNGKVKDMSKSSVYENVISWWKMGDDLDHTGTGGIIDYKSGFNGTLTNGASISPTPELPTDRTSNNGVMIPSSWGRTRGPKNIAGHHQTYIHGGISGNMPTIDPANASDGYNTENQRFLHVYWKAEQTNKTHEITAFSYNHSSRSWSLLYDTQGNQVILNTANAAANIYRVFEISGTDKVYFKSTGTHNLLATDLLAAAASTF